MPITSQLSIAKSNFLIQCSFTESDDWSGMEEHSIQAFCIIIVYQLICFVEKKKKKS